LRIRCTEETISYWDNDPGDNAYMEITQYSWILKYLWIVSDPSLSHNEAENRIH